MCMKIFTAALFIIPQNLKQPKYPPAGEWINMRYIHTTEYYSAIKRN